MQAVILAGGESSRFHPYNKRPKSLIKIAGEPIISHTIRAVKRAGINDIVLLTGSKNYFREVFLDGKKYGVKISYATLDKPTGMGEGLLACAKYIKSDFFLAHAHRVEFDELKKDIDDKRGTNKDVVLIADESKLMSLYGTLKVDGDRVLEVIEKPKKGDEPSRLRLIGIYFLNQDFLSTLKSVPFDHYSFETALDRHAKKGKVKVSITQKKNVSLKYPWDLLHIKNFILSKLRRSISKKAFISKTASIIGDVVIEEGAQISENVVIKGPSYIGRNVFIGNSALVRNSDIEEECKIGAYMEVKNSLILEGSKTHSGFIGDSIIGENTRVGALFGTANVRLDRNNVKVEVKGEKIDSNLRSLGVMVGESVVIGERASTMPGIIIGDNSVIGPSTTVMKSVPPDAIYYTKFEEIIQKNKPTSPKTTSRGGPASK